MKSQTEVEILLNSLETTERLYVEPEGYIIKFFMGCSSVDSKLFKIKDSTFELNQKLKIKNILGDELQLWFCNAQDKIIANATVVLIREGDQTLEIELKLNNILFAKLNCSLSISKTQIEKIVYVEPDEQLLKKEVDPETARQRQEDQRRKLKEQEQIQKQAQKQKKHAITRTHRNKKDEPFL